MPNEWFNFVLNTPTKAENKCHFHVPSEEAEKFHAWDGGSTEMEYLTVLHAMVLATKPACVLETGTSRGLGTLSIAAALQVNGEGKLWTVDTRECLDARKLIASRGLESQVEFVHTNSLAFLEKCSVVFDVAFFDSDHSVRRPEYLLASRLGRLTKGAYCLFHDTSQTRTKVPTDQCYLDWIALLPRVEFPKSRGLTLLVHEGSLTQFPSPGPADG